MRKTITLLIIALFMQNGAKLFSQDAKFQSLILYNFTKLLDWPDKSGDFTVKVLGNDELVKELKDFTVDRKAGGRQTFDVQKAEISNIDQCQMLFVGFSECTNLDQILKSIGNKPTLVITEKSDLTKNGAGISFIKVNGNWKFQFKEENIKKQGLKLSLNFKELGISK